MQANIGRLFVCCTSAPGDGAPDENGHYTSQATPAITKVNDMLLARVSQQKDRDTEEELSPEQAGDEYDELVAEGSRCASREDWRVAAKAFREAISLRPDEPVAYLKLGMALGNSSWHDLETAQPFLLRRSSKEQFGDSARPFEAATSGCDGFLIDLDGTMYQPGGLLPGAREFYRWLIDSGTPYVFLSNTGAKNSLSVQQKFLTAPYQLGADPVPLANILTAAEAQVDFMLATVPPHARILVIQGGSGAWREDLHTRGGAAGVALVDTWQVRTALSDEEAKEWATYSACSRKVKRVWVAFFTDGEIAKLPLGADAHARQHSSCGADEFCEMSGGGFSDWSFEVVKAASLLLSHGAQFTYTADDAFNPSVDPNHPGMMFPLPGPGMFAEMMRKLMYPHGKDAIFCCGKGGNMGGKYMMEPAIELLRQQGHSGERRRIVMVGDRFDTDIRAGLSVGIRTCLVTSGCHNLKCQQFYKMDRAHFYTPTILHLTDGHSEESLRGRLLGHFHNWANVDTDGSGDRMEIDAVELSEALQELGLSPHDMADFAESLEPPMLRRKLQSMLQNIPPPRGSGGSGRSGRSSGGAAARGASFAEASLGANEVSFAEASLGVNEASLAEASCSSKASVARTASLGANEFLEVLSGALGATGVLARKRWQTSFRAALFVGKLASAKAATNVLAQ